MSLAKKYVGQRGNDFITVPFAYFLCENCIKKIMMSELQFSVIRYCAEIFRIEFGEFALKFASDRLRSDKAVVRAALQTDPRFLIDTPTHLVSGVVKLLENRREILLHASSELQMDRELIYLAEG